MKKIITVLIAILCSLNASASINPKPFTVPELTDWQGAEGSMQLSGRVVVNQKSLMPTAKAFVADCQTLLGRKLTVVDHGKAKSGDILLRQHGDKSLGTEGYRLEVGGTCVLTAATPRGAFWGTRTLLQWLEQNAALPCGKAVDVPQYRLRGFMFDVGRKYIPIDYLRQLVRILAYYKMNTLQLHLNDNGFKQYFGDDWKATSAAFRLECDTYPGLTAKDGSYTKAEFIDLQKLAESLGVEIVPEIDSPAHSLAFTHYRPSLASKEIGMDHLDIFKPEVYNFMDSLFAEYLGGREPVFRGQHVNIGTDEYDNSTQERKEQFRHYTDHYLALLQDFGKKPMLWGALTHDDGQTPVRNKGVLMCLWSNYMAEPKEMKRQGWQLVSMPDWQVYIVPLADYYHDYLPCDKLYEEWTPAHFGPVVFDEQDPQLEGGMFALWNDFYGNGITIDDLHDRIFPVLQTVATKSWTGQKTRLSYDDFDRQRQQLSEAPGVNMRGLLPEGGINVARLQPSTTLDLGTDHVGFGHRISFTIDCQREAPGTVLLSNNRCTFYLADPKQGKLGFEREGYLDVFDYRLPESGKVKIALETTHDATTLYVDGQLKEKLEQQRLFVVHGTDKTDRLPNAIWKPQLYLPKTSMRYQRTLAFPLKRTGNFKSQVTDLKVE